MTKINITAELKSKLDILSNEYNIEIGGYLTGETRNGEIYLDDLLIPDQKISTASVEINPKDQINLLKRYGKKTYRIIGHWHSHHSMGCFWSGTDNNNMNEIMTYKKFFVFIVSSKCDHLIKVCVKEPLSFNIDNLSLNVKTVQIEIMRRHIDSILKENSGYRTNFFEDETDNEEENGEKEDEEIVDQYRGEEYD